MERVRATTTVLYRQGRSIAIIFQVFTSATSARNLCVSVTIYPALIVFRNGYFFFVLQDDQGEKLEGESCGLFLGLFNGYNIHCNSQLLKLYI